MWECRHCGEILRGKKEAMPARCPECHRPLFERAQPPEITSSNKPGDSGCAVHPNNIGVGKCKECNSIICAVCRTRWGDNRLCVRCTERNIEAQEEQTESPQTHSRQAIIGLGLGVTGWTLAIVGLVCWLNWFGLQSMVSYLGEVGYLFLVSSICVTVLGLAYAFTSIRTRGHKLSMASSGLALNGSYLGLFLGFLVLLFLRGG